MKKLIYDSIILRGIGNPRIKTIFSIKDDNEINDVNYKPLTTFIGRKLTARFKYVEYIRDIKSEIVEEAFIGIKEGIRKNGNIQVTIPKLKGEDEIQKYIITEIEKSLEILETA